ncbi:putative hydratase/decarboxylase [Marinobacterium nitratireducens]|uniref:Hydratase/decarboxylase n=1 Tax=Marinobacterium nitratireducens TaxID=518897 RepID=A0A918DWU1_9GAMM|nr:2-keto-4-pentenoate hydratase [Marinobacterium nitratireducens]GGO85417.1 putative hydratase/decarboxylase [Marinobacterium nitratireducens]
MSQSRASVAKIAAALDSARILGHPVPSLPDLEEAGIEDGYRVQQELIAINARRGNAITGWKVAMSNRPAMARFGLDEPIYAPLFADMRLSTDRLPPERTIAPKLEAEVAFILNRDLVDESCSDETILAAIGSVAPAFEVADSRSPGWAFDIATFVADNAVASYYLMGELQPFTPEFAFDELQCVLISDGVRREGSSANLIRCPRHSMVEMVRALIERYGAVRAGQHFLTGSLTKPLDMVPDTTYRLEMFDQALKLEFR